MMNLIFHKIVITVIICCTLLPVAAQDIKKVCGEAIYYAPENVTMEQAKQIALQRAKTDALAVAYGTIVSQNNVTTAKNENGKSEINLYSLGGSEVKGEWLETIGEPVYDISYEKGMLVVKVSVCGKAREIVSAGVDFTAKVLRNGTDERFESDQFKDGDELFLLFRSPSDGYLAVYLIDDNGTAYCLLPYRAVPEGKVKIEANKDYLFFSQEAVKGLFPASMIDEYTLTCEKQAEYNYLYVIFSPHHFVKANDCSNSQNTVELLMPRELPFEDFQKWLTKNRTYDKEMTMEIKSLIIMNK